MKYRKLLLIGALAAVMSASAAFAEEAVSEAAAEEVVTEEAAEEAVSEAAGEQEERTDGLLEALFGEGGLLNEVLPEGTDINAMLDTTKEQLDQANSEISQVFDRIYDMTQEEADKFSPDALKEYAEDLLGKFLGIEDDFDFGSLEAYFEINSRYNTAEEEYIKEHNAEILDPADVQIVSQYPIYTVEYTPEDDVITNLAYMIQENYKLNDDNQLLFVCSAEDVVLFRHEKDEEGNYPVVEAVFAEDGENYTSSIEKMCDEAGITTDECFKEIDFAKAAVAYDLKVYLNDHPDIKGIEYDGAIRTAEELEEIFYNALDEMYPAEEEQRGE